MSTFEPEPWHALVLAAMLAGWTCYPPWAIAAEGEKLPNAAHGSIETRIPSGTAQPTEAVKPTPRT